MQSDWQTIKTDVPHPAHRELRGDIIRHERTRVYRLRCGGLIYTLPAEWFAAQLEDDRAPLQPVARQGGTAWTDDERAILTDLASAARAHAARIYQQQGQHAAPLAERRMVDADERGDLTARSWWELIGLEIKRLATPAEPTHDETAHVRAAQS